MHEELPAEQLTFYDHDCRALSRDLYKVLWSYPEPRLLSMSLHQDLLWRICPCFLFPGGRAEVARVWEKQCNSTAYQNSELLM